MDNATSGAFRHGAACPNTELLLTVMEDPADLRRPSMADHISSCLACQTELELYREFAAGDVRPNEQEAISYVVRSLNKSKSGKTRKLTEPWWRRLLTPGWMGGMALAAAALITVIGLSWQWREMRNSTTSYDAAPAFRSNSISFATALGEMANVPSEIRWSPVTNAAAYRVEAREVDQSLIFYKRVTSPSLPMPPELRRLLVPGKTLLFSVAAVDSSDRVIAQSGEIRLRISVP